MWLSRLLPRHAFLDLETTGLDGEKDEVIEAGIVFVERGQLVRRWSRLYRPSQPLLPVIRQLTGLSDSALEHERSFREGAAELFQKLEGWTVVAHNASFERAFLRQVAPEREVPLLDTCELFHYLYPELPSHSLKHLLSWAGMGNSVSHRALHDAEDTFQVAAHALSECVRAGRADDLRDLLSVLDDGSDSPLIALLRTLFETCKSRRPALSLSESTTFLPEPAGRERRLPRVLTLEELLSENGAVADQVASFELRPSQKEMAERVFAAFEKGGTLAIEAPTGTGKSLAYLAAAVSHATLRSESVTVAPHTRVLQDQLVEKELATLHQATGGAFSFAVLKGQQNYLCRRRALEVTEVARELGERRSSRNRFSSVDALPQERNAPEPFRVVGRGRGAASSNAAPSNTVSGQLSLSPREPLDSSHQPRGELASRRAGDAARGEGVESARGADALETGPARSEREPIASSTLAPLDSARGEREKASTTAGRLSWAERAPRAYLRAFLRRSDDGDVERLSHWFVDRYPLLKDLVAASRSSASTSLAERCPHYQRCFFHSAVHHARNADVQVVNQSLLLAWPSRLPKPTTVVIDEAHALEDVATSAFSRELTERALVHWAAQLVLISKRAGEAGAVLNGLRNELLVDLKALAQTLHEAQPGAELAVSTSYRATRPWLKVRDALHGMMRRLEALELCLNDMAGTQSLGTGLKELRLVAELLADRPSDDRCDSMGVTEHGFVFRLEPLDVAQPLRSSLFESARTVVLTSATLSVGPSLERVLPKTEVVKLPSPFNLAERALVVLVNDAPDPQSDAFADWVSQRIAGVSRYLGGRVLGLFSSSKRLNQVGQKVEHALGSSGVEVLMQGRGRSRSLVQRQRSDTGSVLLGTRGFWQGVDVPGPGVSCVFIDKLPFDPMERPLVAAREERFGGFEQYRLPRALLQLRQGVGRLIRSGSDCGVVVICDPGSPRYAAQLYEALSEFRVESLSWEQARLRMHHVLSQWGVASAPSRAPLPKSPRTRPVQQSLGL